MALITALNSPNKSALHSAPEKMLLRDILARREMRGVYSSFFQGLSLFTTGISMQSKYNGVGLCGEGVTRNKTGLCDREAEAGGG